ncbi:putative U5 snRNP-specific 40 kDa protein [Trypanosoma rangeli]|uniref:Putative U5 snRNP-specific 40 kDa protein n=1 Tax=Trypanosoma rangeli TaxID=5698 RepID=A0A422NG23_TRYRA|nr:putative U5 snRNP-specific 40 kDa protein [Trypanosoma rangeli]RNF04410.1 putative U5 snRNP-specific 40 kDa protein [Trypanosoma rangeli]|eukprot:RNF04410.1 putative U5 snRNP-specific 40 kDa protein [Trypanosoma rangeli]
MSLSLVERPVRGATGGGSWFLSGHQKEVLGIATDGSGIFATCDVGGIGLLWRSDAASRDGGPTHVSGIATEGPAIVDACFLRHTHLCTAQGDGTVGMWDVETAQREHSFDRFSGRGRPINWPVINAVTAVNEAFVVFGGDDGFLVLADCKQKKNIATVNLRVPITSLAASRDSFFVGDVLGNIRCFDTRTMRSLYGFKGHRDVVSCMALDVGATSMISYGLDNSLILWDVMPFALSTSDRLLHRIEVQQGASRALLRCDWSKNDTIIVPAGGGHVERVTVAAFEGTRETLPVRHREDVVQCAVFVDDAVAVSSAGTEVILQPV